MHRFYTCFLLLPLHTCYLSKIWMYCFIMDADIIKVTISRYENRKNENLRPCCLGNLLIAEHDFNYELPVVHTHKVKLMALHSKGHLYHFPLLRGNLHSLCFQSAHLKGKCEAGHK